MQAWRRSPWTNPTNWYLLGGVALIAASLWLPWFTAARTARVELRADRIAELLLQACRHLPPEADVDTFAREHYLARFTALATSAGVRIEDLAPLAGPFPDAILLLTNKHYAFQLAVSPPPAEAMVGRDGLPTREVLAWPLAANGPGHSAYFYAEDAPRAYTRNLGSGYVGLAARRPHPGAGQRLQSDPMTRWSSYRSRSDERWILH